MVKNEFSPLSMRLSVGLFYMCIDICICVCVCVCIVAQMVMNLPAMKESWV